MFKLFSSESGWGEVLLHEFGSHELQPIGGVVIDKSGNLYGTTSACTSVCAGTVFKLTPSLAGWTYTSLYEFTGGGEGANPTGNLLLEAAGNLYGTTTTGGAGPCRDGWSGYPGCGVVWEITP